jgi:hypothetical protein
VLKDFELRTDATVVRYPDRYMDDRGTVMWRRVMALLDQDEANTPKTAYLPIPPSPHTPSHRHWRAASVAFLPTHALRARGFAPTARRLLIVAVNPARAWVCVIRLRL